ncbi:KAT8 regulatory NSL complex subunit 1 isoform X1 [Electrophorus electricus]|uniref:PEHE domain-containing protein n=1 Tax=Electrophorus electricus TaxID=8005 RepID=A0A4W4DTN8_ELEEL|nr:KAT8 regulatory NSL complex subunit 1 isoform X1 [Electrophorus electricus]
MSGSVAGPGVQGCAAGRPHSTSLCCGGGGCGELVNGDGSSAAAATATSATPAQCSDRESSVAEAQAFSEWDNATCIDADPARKKNKDGYFLNGTADITREGDECANSRKYGLGRFCAAGRQSGLLGEDNGINIDYEASSFQRGGERLCFMGAPTRRGERRVRARLPSTGPARNRRGQTARPETEEATMTAAARCGYRKSEPVVTKRRGCSFTHASKRVCFSGRRSIAYCDSSDAEDGIGSNGEAPVKNTAGGNSARSQTRAETFKEGYEVDSPNSQHRSSRRPCYESGIGAELLSFTACPPEMTVASRGVSSINSREQSTCRTSKGRVRLYRVRSFFVGSADHHNGVSENGAPVYRRPGPGRDDECREHEQQRRCVRKAQCVLVHSSHNDTHQSLKGLKGAESRTVSPSSHVKYFTEHGGPSLEIRSEASGSQLAVSSVEQVEAVKGEASRRQAELQERMDRLWRRLQAVQVKQVERHVTQQLRDLQRAPGWSCTRGHSAMAQSSVELSRLAQSCSDVLHTAEGALDSDHTASSSGGGSDSEEDEDEDEAEERRGRRMSREWQWMKDRAWLGSRWVWLQAQVSELEYRIRALTELYTHLRQGKVRATHSVPETLLRTSKPSLAYHDCRSSSVGDSLRKRQMEDPAPSPQTPSSPSSSAARVRPLPRQSRHKLILIEGCAALGSKTVTLACSCGPQTVCVLCSCVPSHCSAYKEQRVWTSPSTLDPCIHPVLSAVSDCPLTLHCGTPPLAGSQSQNSMQWMGLSASSWLGRRGQGYQRAGRVRRRLVCSRPPSSLPPLFNMTGGPNCRSQRAVVSPGFLSQQVTDFSPLLATPPAVDTPTQPLRRRRGESSFDIDNLVMPLGLSGLRARVQRLQYKEIITPSWRELDSVCGDSVEQLGQHGGQAPHSHTSHQSPSDVADNDEVEDVSDTVFLKRHAVCESRERNRWGSWARRRRRGRSSSCPGQGKSCRALEQAPCSPDPSLMLFAEGEASPRSPLCSGADDPFYQMEDEQQSVLPWERRSFPLLEAELRWLQEDEEAEPEEDPCAASGRSQSTDSGISVGSLELSPRTPQPQQQKPHSSDMEEPASSQLIRKPAAPAPASTTQDSATLRPHLSSPPSCSAHATPYRHQVSKADARPL